MVETVAGRNKLTRLSMMMCVPENKVVLCLYPRRATMQSCRYLVAKNQYAKLSLGQVTANLPILSIIKFLLFLYEKTFSLSKMMNEILSVTVLSVVKIAPINSKVQLQ